MHEKLKNSSTSFGLGAFRLVSGLILGITFALIGDEILDYGTLTFLFVMVSVTAAFMKLTSTWRIVGVMVFDLICVLVGMLLRLYILIAPGQ